MSRTTEINLNAVEFGHSETLLARHGALVVTAFRYASGVAALRITNQVGEIILLPFHGQQIWDAKGTFVGTYHYTGPMKLTSSLKELNIEGVATFYDPNGTVVESLSFPFTAHCIRL